MQVRKNTHRPAKANSRERFRKRRLLLESLEDRSMMATYNWTGLGFATNTNWSNSGNWSGAVVPSAADTTPVIVFNNTNLGATPAAAQFASTNDIASLQNVTLQFTDASATADFSVSLSNSFTSTSAITNNVTTGTSVTISGAGLMPITTSAIFTPTAGALTINNQISGSGTLSLNNAPGSVVLGNTNSFSGTTTVGTALAGSTANTASLVLKNANALSSSTVEVTNTARLTFDSSVATNTFAFGALQGSANITLQNNAAAAINLTAGGNNASTLYYGNLSGSGSFTKAGTGTLTFGGTHSYTGVTTIANGTIAMANTPSAAPTGQVSRYSFDGNNANDVVGSNNGSLVNTPTFVTGISGKAISFNGTNQYVTVPYSATLGITSNYTVSFWTKLNNQNDAAFFSTRNNSDTTFDIQYSTQKLHGDIGSGGGWINTSADAGPNSATLLPTGNWSMVTYVVTTTGYSIYVNGYLTGSGSYAGTPKLMQAGQVLTLGSQAAGGPVAGQGGFLNALMDEVNIWSSALTPAQISALINTVSFTGTLSPSSRVLIANGATLDLKGTSQTIAGLGDVVAGTGGAVINSAASTPVTLTISNGAGVAISSNVFSGTITDSGAANAISFTKTGFGNQTLAGTVANSFSGPTTISGGELFLAKTAGLNAISSTVVIGAGAAGLDGEGLILQAANQIPDNAVVTINDTGYIAMQGNDETVGSLSGSSGSRIYYRGPTFFSTDVGSGLSTTKTYTHLLDFNGAAGTTGIANVNGVNFATAATADDFTLNAASQTSNNATNVPGTTSGAGAGVHALLEDFNYGAAPGVLTLTNLTPGTTYETRIYIRQWGNAFDRTQRFVFDSDGAGPLSTELYYNEDNSANPVYLSYRYTAAAASMTVTANQTGAGTFHWYGASNEETTPFASKPTLTVGNASNTTFAGMLMEDGNLVKQGTGKLTLSNASNSFSGDVTISNGILEGNASNSVATPTTSAFGSTNSPRTITVNAGAKLQFSASDVMGNSSASPTVTITANGGTVENTGAFFNTLTTLNLNAATLNSVGGSSTTSQAWNLKGTVTIGGSAASSITASGTNSGLNLTTTTAFVVADATASSVSDLNISAPIINQVSGAATGFSMSGAGTMNLSSTGNAYTGVASINGGTLQLGAAGVLPDASDLTLAAGTTLDLNGNSEAWNNINGFGNITNNKTPATPATIGVNAGTYTGNILDGSVSSVGVNKNSAGVLYLGGNNTYTGATNINAGTIRVISSLANPVTIPESSFETPALGANSFQYNPSGSAWAFIPSTAAGGSGISNGPGSPFGNTTAPLGAQVALLQNQGTVTQSITFPSAGSYGISFLSEGRNGAGPNGINILLDGVVVANMTPISNTAFNLAYFNFNVATAGAHTLQFAGTNAAGDKTSFIDNIVIYPGYSNAISDSSSLTIAAGATLDVNGATESTGDLNGAGTINSSSYFGNVKIGANNANGSFSGTVQDGTGKLEFTKIGTGIETFSGTFTQTTGTTILNGTLRLGLADRIQDVVPFTITSPGVFDLNGLNESVNSVSGTGTVDNQAATTTSIFTVGLNNASGTFSGVIANTGSTSTLQLVKSGTGSITLAGTAANTFTGSTTVNNGELILAKTAGMNAIGGNLSVGSGAAGLDAEGVILQSANQIADTASVTLNDTGYLSLGGNDETVGAFTGTSNSRVYYRGPNLFRTNAASDISTSKTYTHLLDFGDGTGATVNGVAFTSAGQTAPVGANWAMTGVGNTYTEATGAAASPTFSDAPNGTGMNQLFSDFIYGGNPATLTLSGLTIGTTYELRLYVRQFGAGANREQTLVFDEDSAGPLASQLVFNADGSASPLYYSYRYTAGATSVTLKVTPTIGGNTLHWYGLSNEVTTPFASKPTLTVGDATSTTFAGIIMEDGNLVKQGAGKLTLSNPNNSFTGNLTVNNGIVEGTASNSVAAPITSTFGSPNNVRNITVNAGAKLQYSASDILGNSTFTPAVSLIANGGTIENTGNFFNTLGPVTLNGGTLNAIGGANATFQAWSLASTVTVGGSSASTITSSGTNSGVHLSATTTFDVADATASNAVDLTVNSTIANRTTGAAGALTKTSAGTMLINSTSYTGLTTITAGTLQLGAANLIYDGVGGNNLFVQAAGTFDLNGFVESLNGLTGSGIVDNTTNTPVTLTIGVNNATSTFSGVLQNSGGGALSLTKDFLGSFTLAGGLANTFTGVTSVLGGTLVLNKTAGVSAVSNTLAVGDADANSESLYLSAADQIPDTAAVTVNTTSFLAMGGNDERVGSLSGGGRIYYRGPALFTTNAASGISSTKTYTHLLDFGNGTGATVNGVAFTAAALPPPVGANWSLTGATNQFPESSGAASSPTFSDAPNGTALNQLFSDFYYNGNPAVLTLAGLTAGTTYEARLYQRYFGGDRTQSFVLDEDGAGPLTHRIDFDEDNNTQTSSYIAFRYTAVSDGAGGALPVTISTAMIGAGTYHWYGVTNEEIAPFASLPTLTVGDSNSTTFSGTIAEDGHLVKEGTGTLTFTNNLSSFTGNITVNGGILEGKASNSVAAPTTTAFGAPNSARTITANSNGKLQFSTSDILGNSTFTPTVSLIANGGTIENTGNFFNTLGPVTLNGGTLNAIGGANATFQAWSLASTVTVGGSSASTITSSGANSGVHLSATTTFDVADATASISPDLIVQASLLNRTNATAAALAKTGAGTMRLMTATTYTGATTITTGTLQLGATNLIYDGAGGSNLFVQAAGTFDLNGFNESLNGFTGTGVVDNTANTPVTLTIGVNNATSTFSGSLQNSGGGALSLTKDFLGSLTLAGGSASTFTGVTSVLGGTLALNKTAGVNAVSNTLVVGDADANSESLYLNAADQIPDTAAVTVNTTGFFAMNNNDDRIGSLTGSGRVYYEGPVLFNTNAASGISTSKTYTHLLDFGNGTGATVNGVAFTAAALPPPVGANWSLTGATIQFPEASGAASSPTFSDAPNGTAMNQLFRDFYYNGNPAVLTLTGLTAGTSYEVRLYQRYFGGDRTQSFVLDEDGAGPLTHRIDFDEDNNTQTSSYIAFRYTAVSDGAGGALPVTISTSMIGAGTYHWYGVTNEELAAIPAAPTLTVGDASNFTFAGTFAQDGNLAKVGTGTFTLAGANTSRGNTSILNGVLSISADNNLGYAPAVPSDTIFINGGTLQNSTSLLLNPNRSIVLGSAAGVGTGTIDTPTGTTLKYAGIIKDNGAQGDNLTKVGNGLLLLSGQSTYTGTTLDSQGTIKLGWNNNGLVANYAFDGTTTDDSANFLNGTINGAGTSYVTGKFGQALNFTGTQNVQIPYNAAFALNSYTVSAWVNLPSLGAGAVYGILGNRLGGDTTFDLKVQTTKIHGDVGTGSAWINTAVDIFNTDTGSNGQSGQLSTNNWHFITYVIDNTAKEFRLFINGDLKKTISFTGTPLFMKPGQTLLIGDTTGGEKMVGAIDDVSIFNHPLSQTEINTLYSGVFATDVLPTTSPVTVTSGATLFTAGVVQTIGKLDGDGTVTGHASLTVGADNGNGTFTGLIKNAGSPFAFGKTGTGTQIITNTNTYSGTTTVQSGTLLVNGSISNSATTVKSGGTLGGSGTTASVVVEAGGHVAPGNSPDQLTVYSVDLNASANLDVEIFGTAIGDGTIGYDQLVVTNGPVLIDQSILNVSFDATRYLPGIGDSFTILDNQSAGTVTGTFAGLPDGAIFTQNSVRMQIHYNVGVGNNDIVLQILSPTTVYVNNNWTTPGVNVDGDLETVAIEQGLVGYSAYATLTAGLAALDASASTSVIVVNGGVYAESITLPAASQAVAVKFVNDPVEVVSSITLNSLSIDSADTLALGGFDANHTTPITLIVGAGNLAGIMSGSGGVTKNTSGTLTLSGINTYAGATAITGGVLSISSDANLGTAPLTATANQLTINSGTLQTTASFTLDANRGLSLGDATLTGNGTFDVATSTTLTYNGLAVDAGPGADALIKLGDGSLVLGGINTYSGSTAINVGTISISSDANLGTAPATPTVGQLILNGGTLATTATLTLNANRGIALGDAAVSGTGTLNIAATTTLTYAGLLADNGAGADNLVVSGSGTLVLSNDNTYTGDTTINTATLQLGSGGVTGSIASANIINNGTLVYNRSNNLLEARGISGTGGLTQLGPGTLTLSGTNTYNGPTAITSSTLLVTGSLGNTAVTIGTGSTLGGTGSIAGSVASTGGKLTLADTTIGTFATGSFTLDATSTLTLEGSLTVALPDPVLNFDLLNVTGSVTLDGTLNLPVLTPSLAPAVGSKYVIISNDGTDAISGTFAGKSEGSTVFSAQGYRFSISYQGGTNNNDVELTYLGRIPAVFDDTYIIDEDNPLATTKDDGVAVNDLIYPGVFFTVLTPPAHGILSKIAADGSFTYTPNKNYQGNDSFVYKATDTGAFDSITNATVSITINNVPDQPIITSGGDLSGLLQGAGNYTSPEGAAVLATMVVDDGDFTINNGPGDSISYSIVSDVDSDGNLFQVSATGKLSFITGSPDFEHPTDSDLDNTYTVFVKATDNTGLFDIQLVSISITNVNDPPTFSTPGITGLVTDITVAENTPSPVTFKAVDQDNATTDLRFNISKDTLAASNLDGGLFSIDPVLGTLTFKQPGGADYDSPQDAGKDNVYNIDVQVSDGVGGVTTNSFTITILPLNDNLPIFATGADLNVNEETQMVTTIAASDVDLKVSATAPTPPLFDNQVVTYSIVPSASGGAPDSDLFSINTNTGLLQFIAAGANYDIVNDKDGNNIYEVTVRANDGFGGTTDRVFHVTLNPVNDLSPVIDNDSLDNVQTTPPINPPLVIRYNEEQPISTIISTLLATDGDRKVGSSPTTFVPADVLEYTLTGTDSTLFNLDKLTGKLTFIEQPNFELPADANKDNNYDLILNVNDGVPGHLQTQAFTVQVRNINDAPIITSNGGLATAAISVNESIGGASVSVTNVVASDDEVTAGSQVLFYTISGGDDSAAFSINKTTGALVFKINPDYENPADKNKDNIYLVKVRVTDSGSPAAFDEQDLTITILNTTTTGSKIVANTSGDIELNDLLNQDNNFNVSFSGGNYIIQDTSVSPDSTIDVSAIPGAKVDSTDGNKVYLPASVFTTGGQHKLVINAGLGNDYVTINAGNSALPVTPSAGLVVNLGGGNNDTLDLDNFINNTGDNIWTTTGAQAGTIALGSGLGNIFFDGLENAIGGNNRDLFKLKYAGVSGIMTINGGDAVNTKDTIEITRSGKFVLTDSQLSITPSTAGQTAGQVNQTFGLSNIKRANLSGSTGNDTFDVSGWTQHGDGTLANNYGGALSALGGTDVVIKRAELTSGTITNGDIQTSDGMRVALAGNILPLVQDTNGATPVSFDISGLSRTGTLIANKNATDEIKLSGSFFNVVLDETYIRVNTTQINLTNFNKSTIVGGGNDQTSWYRNKSWTGTQSFDGGGGTDQVIFSENSNLTMTPTLATIGSRNIQLQNVESFKYKGFDASGVSGNNTINLTDWNNAGVIEGGDGLDQIVIDRSSSSAVQTIDIKPTAMTINGKVINLVKPDVTTWDAQLKGGSGSDAFSLSNWRGTATIAGNGGANTLSINRDRDMDLSTGLVTIKKLASSLTDTDKAINYSNISELTIAGGNGANTYTLGTGYDSGLAAGSNGLKILTNSDGDTLKTSLPMNISVTTGSTSSTIVLGARTLTATNFQTPDIVNFTGTAANAYTFTNYTGKGTLTGMNSVAFTYNAQATNLTVNSTSVQVDSAAKTFTINGTLAGGLSLTGGPQTNLFTVNGWTKSLTINGGTNGTTIKDTLAVTTSAANVTLAGDKTSATLEQSALPTWSLSNIEIAKLTGSKTTGQTFTLSDWSYGGILTANLTGKNDQLVYQSNGNMTLTNGQLTAGTRIWTIANIDTAQLTGGSGDDTIDARNFPGALVIDGGLGNDIIFGGVNNDRLDGNSGDDWIFGNDGNDIITGGNGQDILIGGRGIDRLNTLDGTTLSGDSGEDVLIGGTTNYDMNSTAILAIMTEWSKTGTGNDFVSRVNKLKSLTTKLDSSTVHDDGSPDTLFGGTQEDWYFYAPNDTLPSSLSPLEIAQKVGL